MASFDKYDENNTDSVVQEMVRNSNPSSAVNGLSADQVDVAMKYVYRGMQDADGAQCSAMLKWHEALFEKGGLGSIIRALTERDRNKEKETKDE